jgi:hypothetical protein
MACAGDDQKRFFGHCPAQAIKQIKGWVVEHVWTSGGERGD